MFLPKLPKSYVMEEGGEGGSRVLKGVQGGGGAKGVLEKKN